MHGSTYALLATLLASTGCVEALQRHNEQRHAQARGATIEQACQARDTAALERILASESNAANHARATECYVQIRVDALVTGSCESFEAAFQDTTHMEGRTEVTERNEATGFGPQLQGLPEARRDAIRLRIAQKAASCHDGGVLFGYRGRRLDADRARWPETYAALEHAGQPIYPMLLSYLASAHHEPIDAPSVVTWIEQTKPASRCHELEAATRSESRLRADLLYFFTRKRCRTEAHQVADELLASRAPGLRARACLALRDLGDRSLTRKMQLLAERDTARDLEADYDGFWVITYVTYPVREACQSALNELALRR